MTPSDSNKAATYVVRNDGEDYWYKCLPCKWRGWGYINWVDASHAAKLHAATCDEVNP